MNIELNYKKTEDCTDECIVSVCEGDEILETIRVKSTVEEGYYGYYHWTKDTKDKNSFLVHSITKKYAKNARLEIKDKKIAVLDEDKVIFPTPAGFLREETEVFYHEGIVIRLITRAYDGEREPGLLWEHEESYDWTDHDYPVRIQLIVREANNRTRVLEVKTMRSEVETQDRKTIRYHEDGSVRSIGEEHNTTDGRCEIISKKYEKGSGKLLSVSRWHQMKDENSLSTKQVFKDGVLIREIIGEYNSCNECLFETKRIWKDGIVISEKREGATY